MLHSSPRRIAQADPRVNRSSVRESGMSGCILGCLLPEHGKLPQHPFIPLNAGQRTAAGFAPGRTCVGTAAHSYGHWCRRLRALEDGMRIDVWRVDTLPLGVDTPADLAKARALLAPERRG